MRAALSHADLEIPKAQEVASLVEAYDGPGPRYTSYPTAPHWSEGFGETEFEAALGRARGEDVSIYVHVPFCESLCTYCACNREIHRDHAVADPFLDTLELEASRIAESLGSLRSCVQLSLGGGTPTYLDEAQLARLCDIIDANFTPSPAAERSIEVDPRVTTPGQLEELASRGFNRISLGVQDLSPKVQRAIHRLQSFEQTRSLAEQARDLGFRSVNFDLIYGLPYQTVESFDETLRQVLTLRPDRIALYSYAHVVWVSKQQRGFERKDLPSANGKIAIFLLAMERFAEAGYRFLGMDHFALPEDDLTRAAEDGRLTRNFMGYTTRGGSNLIGLGPSGISELGDAYAQSDRSVKDWRGRLEAGRFATLRGCQLTASDQKRRWLIGQLMCQGVVDMPRFAEEFGEAIGREIPDLAERLAPFEAQGLLRREGPLLRVTTVGRLFLRPMAMSFDAYLEGEAAAAPRYSRTV